MTKTLEEMVSAARAAVNEVDVARARELIAGGAVLVDVREPAEVEQGGIEGAVNIPRGLLEWKIGGAPGLGSQSDPIVVFCQSGGRAAFAAQQLGELGYDNVTSIAGGYAAWNAAED